MSIEQLAFLLIEIILVMIILYLSALIMTGRKEVTTGYLLNLFVVAVLAIFILPVIEAIVSMFFLGSIASFIAFVGLIYIIRYLLKPKKNELIGWEKAIWISLITLIFIAIINYVTQTIFHVSLVNIII